MLDSISSELVKSPIAYATLLTALNFKLSTPKEIVIAGDTESETTKKMLKLLNQDLISNIVIAAGKPLPIEDTKGLPLLRGKSLVKNETTIFVCELGSCKLPTTEHTKAMELLQSK